jgi:hypothetical protein
VDDDSDIPTNVVGMRPDRPVAVMMKYAHRFKPRQSAPLALGAGDVNRSTLIDLNGRWNAEPAKQSAHLATS